MMLSNCLRLKVVVLAVIFLRKGVYLEWWIGLMYGLREGFCRFYRVDFV